jgi:hypothetical protein
MAPVMENPVPIAVAMSGGVDSSTVAAMLAREGYRVVGLTMQLWNQRRLPELAGAGASGRCCSLDDVYDARRVACSVRRPRKDAAGERSTMPNTARCVARPPTMACAMALMADRFSLSASSMPRRTLHASA